MLRIWKYLFLLVFLIVGCAEQVSSNEAEEAPDGETSTHETDELSHQDFATREDATENVVPTLKDVVCHQDVSSSKSKPLYPRQTEVFYIKDPERFLVDYEFVWILGEDEKKYGPTWFCTHNEDVFIETGSYNVTLNINHQQSGNLVLTVPCYYFIPKMPPIVVIEGGHRRTVPTDVDLVINGNETANYYLNDKTPLTLTWSCTQTKEPSTFCDHANVSGDNFVISKENLTAGDVITVVLRAQTEGGPFKEFHQINEVVENAILLNLRCEKNCPPISDYPNQEILTFLYVYCMENCQSVNSADIRWTLSKVVETNSSEGLFFDYEKDTQFGRQGKKFIVKPDVLQPGTYEIKAEYRNSKTGITGLAQMTLTYFSPPEISSCAIQPDTGTSHKTFFTFSCNYTTPIDDEVYDYILLDPDGESMTKGVAPDVFNYPFQLPILVGRLLKVNIFSKNRASRIVDIDLPDLTLPTTKHISEPIYIFEKVYNLSTLEEFHQDVNKKMEQVVIVFHWLINELILKEYDKKNRFDTFLEYLKINAEKDLLKQPETDPDQIIQQGAIYAKTFTRAQDLQTDPVLRRFKSMVCNAMATENWKLIKNSRFRHNKDKEAMDIANILNLCVERNINLVHTVDNSLTAMLTDENEDSDRYAQFIASMEKSTDIFLNATTVNAKAMALTASMGEKFRRIRSDYTRIVVARDHGKYLSRAEIVEGGIRLKLPDELKVDPFHDYQILVVIIEEDIMWWNRQRIRVSTDLANISFWHVVCEKQLKSFLTPANLHFTIKDHAKKRFVQDNLEIPANFTSLKGEELNRCIKVYRVSLQRQMTLRLEFLDLETTDIYDVTFTVFKYPIIEDFKSHQMVGSGHGAFLQYRNKKNYTIWCYIGILPDPAMVTHKKGQTSNLQLNISTSACIHWKGHNHTWEMACKPGQMIDAKTLTCSCTNFSAIGGYVQEINVLRQDLLHPNFELEPSLCRTVFFSVIAVLSLYFALLISIAFRKKQKFYYLADNNRSHRYAYLIVVRTGNSCKSGTTSNVTITLYGTKKKDIAHVLNYPDPQIRILQKDNKETFVLTTDQHLGDIYMIELWIDEIGPAPSWMCKYIVVYDMQRRMEWFFDVNTYFTALTETTYGRFPPVEYSHKRNIWSKLRICSHYHTWYLGQNEVTFSYLKRITTLLSLILTTFVTCLLFYGSPRMMPQDVLDSYDCSNEIMCDSFSIWVGFASSAISFSIHIIIAFLFRFSRIEFILRRDAKEVPMNFEMTIVWWVLVVVLILFSLSYLIVVGFWMPYCSSVMWLISSTTGLLADIIIYENFAVVFKNFVLKSSTVLHTIEDQYKQILEVIESQRTFLYDKFDRQLFRPYFEHLYIPLNYIQIQHKKILSGLRKNIAEELQDLLMFTLYFISLYIVVLTVKDQYMVMSKADIISMMNGEHTKGQSFEEISSIDDIFAFLNETLIPCIEPKYWYGDYKIDRKQNPGLMVDMTNNILGLVRIRQYRIKLDTCTPHDMVKFLNLTCAPEFRMEYADQRKGGYGWSEYGSYMKEAKMQDIWEYHGTDENSITVQGDMAKYSEGGYIAFLDRTRKESFATFKGLYNKYWLDKITRCVFVEFLAYNVHYNVFNSVRLIFEQSATGHTISRVLSRPARMLYSQSGLDLFNVVNVVIFFVWAIMLFVNKSVTAVKKFRTFFKDFWFWADLFIVALTLAMFSLYLVRLNMIAEYSTKLEKSYQTDNDAAQDDDKSSGFIHYFDFYYYEDTMTIIAACLVGVATIRLWKFLRFGRMFRILERTLGLASYALFGTTFAFFVIILAFGLSGILLMGNDYEEFYTLLDICRTLITMALKPDQFEITDFTDTNLSYLFFVLYLLMMQIILFLYVTAIIMGHVKAQQEFSGESDRYTIKNYVMENLYYFPKMLRFHISRLRGGEEQKEWVTPKADEFRYANCISVSKKRVHMMQFVLLCVLRNKRQTAEQRLVLSDEEVSQMLTVCREFLLKKGGEVENELFFKGHFAGEKVRLVDDKRIDRIVEVVVIILNPDYDDDVWAGEDEATRKLAKKKQKWKDYEKCLKIATGWKKSLKKAEFQMRLIHNRVNLIVDKVDHL